jgi:hypothetical protein
LYGLRKRIKSVHMTVTTSELAQTLVMPGCWRHGGECLHGGCFQVADSSQYTAPCRAQETLLTVKSAHIWFLRYPTTTNLSTPRDATDLVVLRQWSDGASIRIAAGPCSGICRRGRRGSPGAAQTGIRTRGYSRLQSGLTG